MNTIAHTSTGTVEGREKEGVALFAGIPYAAPPVGRLRFKAPIPHEPWSGTRSAQRFGPAAPQVATGTLTSRVPVQWDEDCLTLNVSTPAADEKGRPVLVWIHGGAYRTGQGATPWYNGARFSLNGDIVVVSINYRLGALGFARLNRFGEGFATSGLNGTLDQIAALGWVRDNIAEFGGDPEQVTIAGESAGAFSVSTLLAIPKAAGLFQRAIAQSGAGHHTLPTQLGESIADRFCEELGATTGDDVQDASAEAILDAQVKVTTDLTQGHGRPTPVSAFYPVVDGDVLPETAIELVKNGASADVPLLLGTNRHETTLWNNGPVEEERLLETAARLGADEGMLETYRKARPDASATDLLTAITTDHMFRIPAIRMAEAREANSGTSWMYLFAWESRAFGGRLKSTHALEIPFTFNNLDRAGVDVFLGEGPLPQHVADVMHPAWISFIRSGDPATEALPEWPVYTSERRATMVFNNESELVEDPQGAERELWRVLR